VSKLPPFTSDGLLPPGDYELTFDELRHSHLVEGPVGSINWDRSWRSHLIDNLETLVGQLWQIGLTEVFIDGSFVEDKDHPNDIDGYFVCGARQLASGELERTLNLLDQHKVWTWAPTSRKPYHGYPKKQLPMWHQYRVELYPHVPNMKWDCGIRDQFGHELEFPAAFRLSRSDWKPRGIIRIGGHYDSQ